MSYVIDRRLNGKNKSTVNRQRFLRRYRDHIKKAVEEAVSRRSITDMEHGEQISIPSRDIDEPVLHHGRGGRQTIIHPGNKEFTAGERIPRPSGGGGGGSGQGKASNSGEGEDDFVFQITQEEFLDFMFEDLALPNLVKKHLTDILMRQIMPFVQYFSYVEITPREHQALWHEYEQVSEAFPDSFAQQQIVSAADIYPVFRELFPRRVAA
jgi:uncharacterized sporulation protein YeaH/YhbH (DUF444 family)